MMKCNNAGTIQICWGSWGGGDFDHISFSHCSEKSGEREITTTKEYIEAPDLYEFLNKFNQHNPPNHEFPPCRFNQGVDEICDFTLNEKVQKIDNSLSIACNCRCKFCFKMAGNNAPSPDADPNEAFISNDVIKKTYLDTFERIKGHQLFTVRATDNGEPLLYKKELLDYLSRCSRNDFERFGITTNGELLDYEFIDKLKEYSERGNFDVIMQVSLNAFTTETRKEVMKSHRDIKEIMDVIKYARENTSFNMHASIVVIPDNVDELPLLDAWCKENKINFIVSAAMGTSWEKMGIPYKALKQYSFW